MNTPEGPTFCGGCPMQGYCLEPTAENFTVYPVMNYQMDPDGLIQKLETRFTDKDGFNSSAVPLTLSSEVVATPKGNSYQVDAQEAAALMGVQRAVAEKLVDRLARCNGNAIYADGQGRQAVLCPAVGGVVVNELFSREVAAGSVDESLPTLE